MATILGDEQVGERILEIFAYFDVRAGQVLPYQSILSRLRDVRLQYEDLQRGYEWLTDQGYVVVEPNFLRLTDAGFVARPD